VSGKAHCRQAKLADSFFFDALEQANETTFFQELPAFASCSESRGQSNDFVD
jgi:hypothetical protein